MSENLNGVAFTSDDGNAFYVAEDAAHPDEIFFTRMFPDGETVWTSLDAGEVEQVSDFLFNWLHTKVYGLNGEEVVEDG